MSDRAVRVYASGDTFAGELMKGRLESEGIPVMIKGEGEGPYRMGPVYLWVPEAYRARASAVIDAVESGAYALDVNADPSTDASEERSTDCALSASSTEEPSEPSSAHTCGVPSPERRA